MAYIEKMQNIDKNKTSAMNITILLTKGIINGRKLDVSLKKVWVLEWANIMQIAADTRKSTIS